MNEGLNFFVCILEAYTWCRTVTFVKDAIQVCIQNP